MAGQRTAAAQTATGRRFTRFFAVAAMASALAGGWAAGAADAQDPPGQVRVVHGLRGLVADIYLDGALGAADVPTRAVAPSRCRSRPVITSSRSAPPARR